MVATGVDNRLMPDSPHAPRLATPSDAAIVAELLDRFNREYGTPTPGVHALTTRLERLLGGSDVFAVIAGAPAVGVALLTLRPNVWYQGPVALLDELYVEPAIRGRGIGTALLKSAQAICRGRGVELLEINVDGEDEDARRFYERNGFVNREPNQAEPQLYYFRELGSGPI
jgi:GNAT superfamily N-acetyltransferase